MTAILFILGVLQMVGGVAVTLVAKSAMHEILGAISFGMGVLAVGIGVLISKLHDVKVSTQRQVDLLTAFRDRRRV